MQKVSIFPSNSIKSTNLPHEKETDLEKQAKIQENFWHDI
jgi:hypothetical protein